jgi:ankyrin repeat protein
MIAAKMGNDRLVELLLEKGANVHPVDVERRDALTWACDNNQQSTAAILCTHGAPLQHYLEKHHGNIGGVPNVCTTAEFYQENTKHERRVHEEDDEGGMKAEL